MRTNTAYITPKIINWAIVRSNKSMETVAAYIKESENELNSWIKGNSFPTFSKAKKLAKYLNIPFGYLFLSKPPEEKIPIPDFRTVSSYERNKFSPEFIDLINSVRIKQDWYSEFVKTNGAPPFSPNDEFTIEDDHIEIAGDIRRRIGISENFRKTCSSWYSFLLALTKIVENYGIVVLKSGIVGSNNQRKLDIREFRGFSIFNDYAPFIFINNNDSVSARIFTLAHELAHIWLGESGISSPDIDIRKKPQNEIENFCNKVAAEVLVPYIQFEEIWNANLDAGENINALAKYFRVSTLVVLRRAFERKIIGKDRYDNLYKELLDNLPKNKPGKGNYYNNILAWNGHHLTNAVIAATYERQLSFNDGMDMLSIKKIKTFNKLAQELGIR